MPDLSRAQWEEVVKLMVLLKMEEGSDEAMSPMDALRETLVILSIDDELINLMEDLASLKAERTLAQA